MRANHLKSDGTSNVKTWYWDMRPGCSFYNWQTFCWCQPKMAHVIANDLSYLEAGVSDFSCLLACMHTDSNSVSVSNKSKPQHFCHQSCFPWFLPHVTMLSTALNNHEVDGARSLCSVHSVIWWKMEGLCFKSFANNRKRRETDCILYIPFHTERRGL